MTIDVADACGGLPPGKVDDLFSPLVQRGENRSGFGLGLAIARQAVEAHGGRIGGRATCPGTGCVFTIELGSSPRSSRNRPRDAGIEGFAMETGDGVREVEKLVTAHKQREGGGFIVRRPFPGLGITAVDPFLLLDEMGPVEYAPGEAVGAPDHPHRGFETVTYVLEGELEHEDSAGHRGSLRAGDVQWMTAGAGIVHAEMPSRALREQGGRVHGFQVWVNLPAR